MMSEYEVYALKYAGPFSVYSPFLVWQRDMASTEFEMENWYIWCVRSAGQTVVVDTGAHPLLTRERKRSDLYESPALVLARLGIDACEVEHVVLTHLHWDHSGGLALFPRARFYVQATEYDFWVEDPISRRPPFRHLSDPSATRMLAALRDAARLETLNGDAQILPGLECLLVPGHSPGFQALAVQTAHGTAVIGSDCAHVFRNYALDWPSAFTMDLVSCVRSYDKLRGKAASPDLIFPGHDVLLHEAYPQVAQGVTRLA